MDKAMTATAEWDVPGFAVVIDDQGRELSDRMDGVFHLQAFRDQTDMTFTPSGDGRFVVNVPGVACMVRYRLADGFQVEDDRPFVLGDGAEVRLAT